MGVRHDNLNRFPWSSAENLRCVGLDDGKGSKRGLWPNMEANCLSFGKGNLQAIKCWVPAISFFSLYSKLFSYSLGSS